MLKPGFPTPQDHKQLKGRAWLVGGLSMLLQVALPIAVLVASFATLVSACSRALTGPKLDAGGAVFHEGRIWLSSQAPLEDDTDEAPEGDEPEEIKERRLLLLSADPSGGELRTEHEVLRSRRLTIFDGSGRLLVHNGRLLLFAEEAIHIGASGQTLAYPEESGRGRPFLLDGKPALPIKGYQKLTLMVLHEDGWQSERSWLIDDEALPYFRTSSLQLMKSGDRLLGYALTSDDELLQFKLDGSELAVAQKHNGVDDFTLAQIDGRPQLIYVTAGPGLDELLDDLEDGTPPGQERPKTQLVARVPGGEQLWSKPALGADNVAVVQLGDGSYALVSEHDDGIDVRPYRGGTLGEPIEIRPAGGLSVTTTLVLLVLLWFFGGGLITLLVAVLMSSGMARHRNTAEVGYYASLTRRTLARGIDSALVVGAVAGVMLPAARAGAEGETLGQLVGLLVGIVLLVLEAHTGRTPGKWLLGIMVQNQQGQPPGLRAAFLRSLLTCVDGLFGGLLGVLTIAFSPYWQRLGDSVAHTIVVRVRKPDGATPAGDSTIGNAALLMAVLLLCGCPDDGARSADASPSNSPASTQASPSQAGTSQPPASAGMASGTAAPANTATGAASASASAVAMAGGMLSTESQDALLALIPPYPDKAERFLRRHIGPGNGGKSNQGNGELSKRSISKAQCLAGLRGMTLQTPEQKERCGGHDNMVPLYTDGDPAKARVCIDIFEFPNKACELPFVWTGATIARELCKRVGKRLCKQQEWTLACEGDPAGGKPSRYAYGETLDLNICNTNKSARVFNEGDCDPTSVKSTYETCSTNTEPAGAFPRCRSRFGVFDLHGNVAEAMTRWDAEEEMTVSQLKGSAFFYVDVHVKDGGKRSKETYPDHCRYDPRWHVQPMSKAWHVNYHLGFRCCADIKPKR